MGLRLMIHMLLFHKIIYHLHESSLVKQSFQSDSGIYSPLFSKSLYQPLILPSSLSLSPSTFTSPTQLPRLVPPCVREKRPISSVLKIQFRGFRRVKPTFLVNLMQGTSLYAERKDPYFLLLPCFSSLGIFCLPLSNKFLQMYLGVLLDCLECSVLPEYAGQGSCWISPLWDKSQGTLCLCPE